MTFYGKWLKAMDDKEVEGPFLQRYLDYSPESTQVLLSGDKADVVEAIKTLLSVPVSKLIDTIDHPYPLSSKDIFQYSKLYDATETLCNLLEYEHFSLSYEEAGKELTHAQQQYACIKYGENHAKTASMLSLVVIAKEPNRKCNMVRISPLGSVYTMLSSEDKNELLRRLAIRNPLMKTLIYNAKIGNASYKEAVSSVLTGQTIIRRKHNNEILMNIVLGDEPISERIRWQ